jgi:hypothetical protein
MFLCTTANFIGLPSLPRASHGKSGIVGYVLAARVRLRESIMRLGIARILQLASFATGFVAFSVLLLGICRIGNAPAQSVNRGLVVQQPIKSLGSLQAGSVVPLLFTLTNTTARPIRILGSGDKCVLWGCLASKNLPVVIPPKAGGRVEIKLKTAHRGFSGAFDGAIVLFTDSPVTTHVSLGVTGRIVPRQDGY